MKKQNGMVRGRVYNYKADSCNDLTSGASWYPYAVCVSVEPFVLVSEHGDMLWQSTIDKELDDFEEVDVVVDTDAAYKRYYGEAYNCIVILDEV